MDHIKSLSKALSNLSLTKEAFDVRLSPFIIAMYEIFPIDPERFIVANKSDIEKIERIANGHYKFLHSGGEGPAWQIGKQGDYVLKITITPALDSPKDGGPPTIHKEPTQDAKDVSDILWSKIPGAQHEIMIRANGELQIIYHSKSRPPKRVWWKIIEYLDTSIMDEEQDDVDSLIGLILHRLLEMANVQRGELNLYDSLIRHDIYSTDNAVVLGAKDPVTRKDLVKKLTAIIRHNSEVKQIVFDLGTALSPGWLEDFVDSILYLMAVRDKGDFSPNNVGIRESTGRLVWFDA